jgi:quercetin dioxygenase-like cupin family protein
MSTTTKRTFSSPDATNSTMEKIRVDVVDIDGTPLSRVTAEPGWRWSVHSKPIQKTDSCQVDHLFYVISGGVGTSDSQGLETVYATGDLAHIRPGHDGWTIGSEPAIWIEVPH